MANDQFSGAVAAPRASELATNKVLKNTYMLLAATLGFAAITAYIAMAMDMPRMSLPVLLIGFFGLLFLVRSTANSAWGLLSVFAFTGFLGLSAGATIDAYLTFVPNGQAMVVQAFGLTAFAFVGLSAYVVTTKADMSFLRGFIVVGFMLMLGMIAVGLVMYFMGQTLPSGVMLAYSSFVVLLMSAFILYETGEIVSGGETNYINANHLAVPVYLQHVHESLEHLRHHGRRLVAHSHPTTPLGSPAKRCSPLPRRK